MLFYNSCEESTFVCNRWCNYHCMTSSYLDKFRAFGHARMLLCYMMAKCGNHATKKACYELQLRDISCFWAMKANCALRHQLETRLPLPVRGLQTLFFHLLPLVSSSRSQSAAGYQLRQLTARSFIHRNQCIQAIDSSTFTSTLTLVVGNFPLIRYNFSAVVRTWRENTL